MQFISPHPLHKRKTQGLLLKIKELLLSFSLLSF